MKQHSEIREGPGGFAYIQGGDDFVGIFPEDSRKKLQMNVWCGHCHQGMTITNFACVNMVALTGSPNPLINWRCHPIRIQAIVDEKERKQH